MRSVVLLCLAGPSAFAALHQHLTAAPAGWSEIEIQRNNNAEAKFTISLAMQNIDQLEATLLSISDPDSPEYGKFKTIEGVHEAFAPSPEAVRSVTSWLKSTGIVNYQVDGAFIDFTADIPTANSVFNASYRYYAHNDVVKLRTLSYSISEEVQNHITYLDPSNYFGRTNAFSPEYNGIEAKRDEGSTMQATTNTSSCDPYITPSCLRELYTIGNYAPSVNSGSQVGFGSFLKGSSISDDIAKFEELFGIPSQNLSKLLIAGGVNNEDPANGHFGEADLDAETIIGISHPLPVTEYITGGSPPFIPDIDVPENNNEPYVPFLRYLLSKPNHEIPQVISISYGEPEDTVPYEYAVLACNLFGLQGLRGITILIASGDIGVGAGCLAPDNRTVEFNPPFPSTCPFVTTIGGTIGQSSTVAWNGSSGGFSKYFLRPSYQDTVVNTYLENIGSETIQYYSNYTNFNGRGFPDAAAHANLFQVIKNGSQALSGGTSASAPVWAGVVALLNDARLRAGKSVLGWLNPLLYKYGDQALVDVTAGRSVGCNGINPQTGRPEPEGAAIVPGAFWNATEGWDPVTGFGIPNFDKLKKLVLSF
ncbi:subtilisin-like protein [Thozetella sp. PMI_491]|nr:subtilisin-like protein [Thozetella sp. PMI_491]